MSAAETVAAAIARAKPFIDDGPIDENAWLPSELLTIGFAMIETGRGGMEAAVAFVDSMLAEARDRYAAGFWANPFMEPVRVRVGRSSQEDRQS
ncbi:hypothetical protein F1C10_03945 [Sphingomonas sp. NBWT7]|uniref:hypothetical protein n=1 Tax=Sphingomonas sp. NBWT7 TaxID=2596913 RepID=UPI00162420A1|nr:hypothetical protein [Sphingomonas sp. NBWT7]QNE31174.1 hypothetical protein F1C10_03945 [Sphingomonas sp. NBWT7]